VGHRRSLADGTIKACWPARATRLLAIVPAAS
jgi:hypothetical protein